MFELKTCFATVNAGHRVARLHRRREDFDSKGTARTRVSLSVAHLNKRRYPEKTAAGGSSRRPLFDAGEDGAPGDPCLSHAMQQLLANVAPRGGRGGFLGEGCNLQIYPKPRGDLKRFAPFADVTTPPTPDPVRWQLRCIRHSYAE